MKSKIAYLLLFIIACSNIIGQEELPPPFEVYVNNYSLTKKFVIRAYPISMVFNGWEAFDLLAKSRNGISGDYYTYINAAGVVNDILKYEIEVGPNTTGDQKGFNFDDTDGPYAFANFGYGRYKLLLSVPNPSDENTILYSDTLILDFDRGSDIAINFRDDNNNPRFTFNGTVANGPCPEWNIIYNIL